jgi:hypothetical protein
MPAVSCSGAAGMAAMEEQVSTWFVSALMVLLGILGVVLAACARDDGMYVFGFSLSAFAVLFIYNLIRKGR